MSTETETVPQTETATPAVAQKAKRTYHPDEPFMKAWHKAFKEGQTAAELAKTLNMAVGSIKQRAESINKTLKDFPELHLPKLKDGRAGRVKATPTQLGETARKVLEALRAEQAPETPEVPETAETPEAPQS